MLIKKTGAASKSDRLILHKIIDCLLSDRELALILDDLAADAVFCHDLDLIITQRHLVGR